MRILVLDKRSIIRFSLKMLIEQSTFHNVVAEVAQVDNLSSSIYETTPDLVLLEWELLQGIKSEMIASLKAEHPQLKVIVISGQPSCRNSAFDAGADEFMSKVDPPDRLLHLLKSYE